MCKNSVILRGIISISFEREVMLLPEVFYVVRKIPAGDKDKLPLSPYSPEPFKVKNPEIQTVPPENPGHGPYPSKETFPNAHKKNL